MVRAPAPAIKGKATGTIVASLGLLGVDLNISISRIISTAITKMIKEPAIANELISMLNSFKIASPTYRKLKNINNDAMLQVEGLIVFPHARKRRNIGIEPKTSIIAKRITKELKNSWKLKCENII